MKTYLVGGAVRDALLNYPVSERDWVVVDASCEQLRAQGYQQVGKDFPVFLHPETKEEVALARTERKVGAGYQGFAFEVAHVSLKEDLSRRDLTINAMAMDEDGQLIDPFNGQKDLKDKILRHVSKAFCEDPVRVLRVARFAARYAHLGFRLAPETTQLMSAMVESGEVNFLVAERVWKEFERSLTEKNPEVFIEVLRQCGALKVIMPELDNLFGVPNPPNHHPEIDSGVHSLMVLKVACLLSSDAGVRFAALVHDLGKACSPMSQWPSHRGHDNAGVDLIKAFCKRLRINKSYEALACLASQYHILIHKFRELTPAKKVTILESLDAFRRLKRFEQLLMVCEADSRGRLGFENKQYLQKTSWQELLLALKAVDVKDIVSQGHQGVEVARQLHQRRVSLVKQLLRQCDEK